MDLDLNSVVESEILSLISIQVIRMIKLGNMYLFNGRLLVLGTHWLRNLLMTLLDENFLTCVFCAFNHLLTSYSLVIPLQISGYIELVRNLLIMQVLNTFFMNHAIYFQFELL